MAADACDMTNRYALPHKGEGKIYWHFCRPHEGKDRIEDDLKSRIVACACSARWRTQGLRGHISAHPRQPHLRPRTTCGNGVRYTTEDEVEIGLTKSCGQDGARVEDAAESSSTEIFRARPESMPCSMASADRGAVHRGRRAATHLRCLRSARSRYRARGTSEKKRPDQHAQLGANSQDHRFKARLSDARTWHHDGGGSIEEAAVIAGAE